MHALLVRLAQTALGMGVFVRQGAARFPGEALRWGVSWAAKSIPCLLCGSQESGGEETGARQTGGKETGGVRLEALVAKMLARGEMHDVILQGLDADLLARRPEVRRPRAADASEGSGGH